MVIYRMREKFLLISDALEIKVGRKYLSGICNVRNVQYQRTLLTKICGIEVNDKGITSMYNLKFVSRDKRNKLLE